MKDKLENILGSKKIVILGMGREGMSSYKFIKKIYPGVKLATRDQKNGKDYLDNLTDFDLVIKSPGISWNLPKIKEAVDRGLIFTSQTQIFLDMFKSQTIGVTGTKGKSTTAALIYHILKVSGKKVKLVGNIGTPVFDYMDESDTDTIFVYEMSSHQLSDLSESPHIAVFLNFYPEHLDYYKDLNDYFFAKANITKFQDRGDFFIYSSDFPMIKELARSSKAKSVSFSTGESLTKYGLGGLKNQLAGKHNLNNIKAAVLAVRKYRVSNKTVMQALSTFEPLDDRLQVVAKVRGVTFVDDSLATIPEATKEAINSFEGQKITLILGGFDRGLEFDILGKHAAQVRDVENIILIGRTAGKIKAALKKYNYQGKIHDLGVAGMTDIVNLAFEVTPKGGCVLLSPAATSFDMFKDYKDRADQFKAAVENLKVK